MINPTPELFREAAQIIRERGLAREKLVKPDGTVCLMGACGIAAHLPDLDEAAYMTQVHRALAETIENRDVPLTDFAFSIVSQHNDYELEDAEQAAQLLERAAARLEEQEDVT
jgi:hypothetical protein